MAAEYMSVPLVMYVHGHRRVIGETIIDSDNLEHHLDRELAEEVLDQLGLHHDTAIFTLSYAPPKNPELLQARTLAAELTSEFFTAVSKDFLDTAERLDPEQDKKECA